MPLLAAFLGSILSVAYKALIYLVGARFAARVAVALALSGAYIGSVVVFNSMVSVWLEQVFSTQYGALLGLLFPPVAGTVLASLSVFWTSLVALHYVRGLTKTALGG